MTRPVDARDTERWIAQNLEFWSYAPCGPFDAPVDEVRCCHAVSGIGVSMVQCARKATVHFAGYRLCSQHAKRYATAALPQEGRTP